MACGGGGPMVSAEENAGGRKVLCVKFQREMTGLDEPPFDGHPIGQKIYENVSKEAWKMWIEHLKMLMNEYRLNLAMPEAQEFLIKEMEKYFFGAGSALPPDFVAAKEK
jgi:Fe-S cluster biosynthesis and repair protein YggX